MFWSYNQGWGYVPDLGKFAGKAYQSRRSFQTSPVPQPTILSSHSPPCHLRLLNLNQLAILRNISLRQSQVGIKDYMMRVCIWMIGLVAYVPFAGTQACDPTEIVKCATSLSDVAASIGTNPTEDDIKRVCRWVMQTCLAQSQPCQSAHRLCVCTTVPVNTGHTDGDHPLQVKCSCASFWHNMFLQ